MSCQKCKSDRIVNISAKCSDLCTVTFGGQEKNDYVPNDLGIGGGDYVRFDLCLDCGQIQGAFPLPKSELEAAAEDEPIPDDLFDVDLSSAYNAPAPDPVPEIPEPTSSIPDSSIPETPDYGSSSDSFSSSSSDFGGGSSD
jgi:hypothetical protein